MLIKSSSTKYTRPKKRKIANAKAKKKKNVPEME